MQISALRLRYQAALKRSLNHDSTAHIHRRSRSKISAEDDARLDATSNAARGGARRADTYVSSDAHLEYAAGYSRQRILGTSTKPDAGHLRQVAGYSHADEARVNNRVRQMQNLLRTMNRVQLRALTTGPA